MAIQDSAEQDDPLGLENIKTLVDIEASQGSLPKTLSENLLAAGLVTLFSGLWEIVMGRRSSPEERMLREIKRYGKDLAEMNKILRKHGFTPEGRRIK